MHATEKKEVRAGGGKVNAMIEMVNAEAEVIESQRRLREAQMRRDRVREGKE
jgi:hypothetical protein